MMFIYSLTLVILTPFLAIFAIQQFIIVPRLRKELFDLNARRADRVQQALAVAMQSAWQQPAIALNYPFVGWLDLKTDGTIRIAGQSFSATQQFQITARDDHHIPRATAISRGTGEVLINSHGQAFIARFEQGQWQVQSTTGLSQ